MSENASTGSESESNPSAATETSKTAEWYEAELAKVRNEAASTRVKGHERVAAARQEAETAAAAKLAEAENAKGEAVAKATLFEQNFTRYETAVSTVLTSLLGDERAKAVSAQVLTFAKAIQGNTPEEMAKHASELRGLFGQPAAPTSATDHSQGRGGGTSTGSSDSSFADYVVSLLDRR